MLPVSAPLEKQGTAQPQTISQHMVYLQGKSRRAGALSPKGHDAGREDSYGCCGFPFLAKSRLSPRTGSAPS